MDKYSHGHPCNSPDTRSADIVVNTIIAKLVALVTRLKILWDFHARPNVHGALRGFQSFLTITNSSIFHIIMKSFFLLDLLGFNMIDCL